ncbi:gag-proteinase polyprotein [Cucumis melo var. makuwa]|uniref:Gag-proteinase polyprotein n=1 Tax=Cucumis melo var. makuwa TaxID=1194695 RepID=A0A5D3BG63_CUCMM|nr:gag-proteinase polyprotein [Cucumis melo var. makuwa]
MDFVREGTSTTKPSILDGTNYGYWKAKMIAFLKSVDSRSWKSVLTGWEPPSIIDATGIITLKPKIPWNKEEDEESFGNSKVLNALLNGVDQNVLKLINTCTSAKKIWSILEVAYKGIAKLKVSRLLILTSRFEALRMNNDETIAEFKKVLRSLPSKAIEEANDITIMKLDELFGSLHTFEFSFKDQAIALLSKHFTKFKNKFYKKSGGYDSQTNRDGDKSGKSDKSVRCHECEGYRHFQAEYPTYLKIKKKSVNITLLDEDTLSDSECEDYGRALNNCEAEGSSELPNNDELLLQAIIEPKPNAYLEREDIAEDQLPIPIPHIDFEELLYL